MKYMIQFVQSAINEFKNKYDIQNSHIVKCILNDKTFLNRMAFILQQYKCIYIHSVRSYNYDSNTILTDTCGHVTKVLPNGIVVFCQLASSDHLLNDHTFIKKNVDVIKLETRQNVIYMNFVGMYHTIVNDLVKLIEYHIFKNVDHKKTITCSLNKDIEMFKKCMEQMSTDPNIFKSDISIDKNVVHFYTININ